MAYEELELRAHLWRQKDDSGIFLCYQLGGIIPIGLHHGESKLFPTETAVANALTDAHISLSVGTKEQHLSLAWRCGN